MEKPDDRALRQALVDTVTRLDAAGYNHGTSGNVSCRSGAELLISPTGANAATLTADRIVRLAPDGSVVGDGVPSSEWHMHRAILNAYPAVDAVIHTHADCCVALSCLQRPLPAFHYMIAAFGGADVRCAPYATFGTAALADNAVEALRDRRACLLSNHGMIAVGASLEAALNLTIKLETLARQYLLACQAGSPVILPDAEIARVLERYSGYGRTRLSG